MMLSRLPLLSILLLPLFVTAEERRDCREQEFKDMSGSCVPCRQCDAGQELSKECGFGFGEDARCVPCRGSRFKEERSLQKCKPCMDCSLLNRFLKSNCSSTRNALCGDCLPGFYRKTKLSGFQDMECIPCGDPPPPYEPHCMGRVKLVPLPSAVDNPRDVALAAVICSALASVLLALCILCVIYCKRQLLESKPVSLRHLEGPSVGSELSCLDRRLLEHPERSCCHCVHRHEHMHSPVELIPSVCCDESWSQSRHQNQPIYTTTDGLDCQQSLAYVSEEVCPLVQKRRSTDSEAQQRSLSNEEDDDDKQTPHTSEGAIQTDG